MHVSGSAIAMNYVTHGKDWIRLASINDVTDQSLYFIAVRCPISANAADVCHLQQALPISIDDT